MNRRTPRKLLSKMVKRAPVLLLLGIVCAFARTAAADDDRSLEQDASAFFEWWDARGLPNLKDAPFVRYRPGWGRASGGADSGWDQGFLLAETERDFTVLGTDLWTRRWEKPKPDDAANATGFERADLPATVQAGVALLSAPRSGTLRADPFVFERIYWQRASYRVLVLARACAARGLSKAALSLLPFATEEMTATDPKSRLERWKCAAPA